MIIENFYARLSLDNRNLLDTSCAGSYMLKTIDFKWDLLERIKHNYEDWGSDDGKESGMTTKFDCVKSFMIPMFFMDLALSMDLTMRY